MLVYGFAKLCGTYLSNDIQGHSAVTTSVFPTSPFIGCIVPFGLIILGPISSWIRKGCGVVHESSHHPGTIKPPVTHASYIRIPLLIYMSIDSPKSNSIHIVQRKSPKFSLSKNQQHRLSAFNAPQCQLQYSHRPSMPRSMSRISSPSCTNNPSTKSLQFLKPRRSSRQQSSATSRTSHPAVMRKRNSTT